MVPMHYLRFREHPTRTEDLKLDGRRLLRVFVQRSRYILEIGGRYHSQTTARFSAARYETLQEVPGDSKGLKKLTLGDYLESLLDDARESNVAE